MSASISKRFTFDRQIAGGVCSVGVPGNDSKPAECHRMTVLNNFTAGFGEQAVAAMGIGQKARYDPDAGQHGAEPRHYAACWL